MVTIIYKRTDETIYIFDYKSFISQHPYANCNSSYHKIMSIQMDIFDDTKKVSVYNIEPAVNRQLQD